MLFVLFVLFVVLFLSRSFSSLPGLPRAFADEGAWRYVVPKPGEPQETPPLCALSLSPQRPEDLRESVRYRGTRQRYAQITYGSPGTALLTAVLDEISPDEVDLYLDQERKRIIRPTDRINGTGGTWRVSLDAQTLVDGRTEKTARTVLLRYGRLSGTLGIATCGRLEGLVSIAGRPVTVQRVDGDGNGLFADCKDRISLDLDGDGRFDPVQERFLFAPILPLGDVRHAVRSDALGRHLTLAKLEGTGTVRLRFAASLNVEDATATLYGRDGTVASLRGATGETTVPVGDYRVANLILTLPGSPSWSYIFSDNGARLPHRWYRIDKGANIALDPIGKLELQAFIEEEDRTCLPGQHVRIQPRLYTGDGLLISRVFRGTDETSARGSSNQAKVCLTTAEGRLLGEAASGFA